MNVRITLEGSTVEIHNTLVAFRQQGVGVITYYNKLVERGTGTKNSRYLVNAWSDGGKSLTSFAGNIRERDIVLAKMISQITMRIS